MATTSNIRLIRWVKVGLDVLFGGVVIASCILVLLTATAPLLANRFGTPLTVSIPVTVGAGDTPQFDVSFAGSSSAVIQAAVVEEAQGTLRLETKNLPLIAVANLAKLLTGLGFAYVLWLLRGIVQKVQDGDPFAEENGRRIRRLGFAVLGVGILVPVVQYLASLEILSWLSAPVPLIRPGPLFDNQVILISLLILVLAHIWSYGLELERERSLTV